MTEYFIVWFAGKCARDVDIATTTESDVIYKEHTIFSSSVQDIVLGVVFSVLALLIVFITVYYQYRRYRRQRRMQQYLRYCIVWFLCFFFFIFFVSSPELKAQVSFTNRLSSFGLSRYFSHFHLLLQDQYTNFNRTWHKASFGKGIQICSNKGSCPYPRGVNNEIAKIHLGSLNKNLPYPKPMGQFQANVTQSILEWRRFKFVQMKCHTLSKLRW